MERVQTRHGHAFAYWLSQLLVKLHTYDVMVSCDSKAAIPRFIASIVVAMVAMHGESWLV